MSTKPHEDRLAELKEVKNPTPEQKEELVNIEKYLASLKEAPKAEEPKAAPKAKKSGKKSKKA